jgi:hypothetical protein
MNLARPPAQLIVAGAYDQVHGGISEYFRTAPWVPVRESRTTLIHLLHYKKAMSSSAVLANMSHQNLRPTTLAELVWLGIRHPGLRVTVIALGIEIQLGRYRRAASLYRVDQRRCLDLPWLAHGWDRHCRFAAVHR